jgi:hypothetical protein
VRRLLLFAVIISKFQNEEYLTTHYESRFKGMDPVVIELLRSTSAILTRIQLRLGQLQKDLLIHLLIHLVTHNATTMHDTVAGGYLAGTTVLLRECSLLLRG